MTLNEVCNVIILCSAVILAIKNIYQFFKKPVDVAQDKALQREEKRIEEVIEQRVPELLTKYSESMKEERALEDKQRATAIANEVITALDDKIEELKEISIDQGREIRQIQASLDLLNNAQLDTMRYNMNKIYYKYRPYKKILDYDKKAFLKLYSDYKPMGGNTWIDTLYQELINWESVQDASGLKIEGEE